MNFIDYIADLVFDRLADSLVNQLADHLPFDLHPTA